MNISQKTLSAGLVVLLLLSLAGCVRKKLTSPPRAEELGRLKPLSRPGVEAFRGGEKLIFVVKYWVIPVGRISLEVREMNYRGHEVYSPLLYLKANRLFSFFCPAEGEIRSYFDAQGLFTHRYEEHYLAGRHIYDRVTTYDQKRRIAQFDVPVYNDLGQLVKKEKKKVNIPPRTQDVLSVFYYIRTRELKEGAIIKVKVNERKHNYQLELKVLGKEEVKTPAGSFLAWVIEPTVLYKGKKQERGKGLVYLSADSRKSPLLIRGNTSIGRVSLYLIDVRL